MDDDRRTMLMQRRETLRFERELCEHGVTVYTHDSRGGCAGAVGRCRCCSQQFCYADSGGSDGVTEWSSNWTKDLCIYCGGHSIKTEKPVP